MTTPRSDRGIQATNSFTADEVKALVFVCTALARGGSPQMVVRSKGFAGVYRKALSMQKRIEELREKREAKAAGEDGTNGTPTR
jgi:hypothetical protein